MFDDNVNAINYFESAVDFIKSGLTSVSVLVHCFAGRSRSSTFVLAYLISEFQLGYTQALHYLQKYHPIAMPNFFFSKQLEQFSIKLHKHKK